MKAIWNDTIIAEAEPTDLIKIEGNWYFPAETIKKEFFSPSDMHTTCIWKGDASYYDVTVDGKANENAAWYYSQPKAGSVDWVKRDFSNYVAFWRGVKVEE